MDRKKELAKNTAILMVGKILTQFVSFFMLPLYTAVLTPGEYGLVDLFNTYCTLLLPLFNWQFDSGLFRFLLDVRDNKEGQKKIVSAVLSVCFIQSVIYLLFFAVAKNFITAEYKYYLAIDVVLNIFLSALLQFARGIGKTTNYTVSSFISATSNICLNVLFIAVLRFGAEGMFLATVLSKVVTILYMTISLKVVRYYAVHLIDKSVIKQIARYSFPLIPNQLSWWVVGVSDRVIVSKVIGVAANGVYSIANKFSGLFVSFYNIFNLSWTESVSLHLDEEDSEKFLTETINDMFKLFTCTCIEIVAVLPFAFFVVINNQYADAYNHVPILMLAVVFQIIVGLYSVIYVALKKTHEIAKTSFFAAVINISTNVALIKFIGLYAASVSTFVAYFSMAIYRYIDIKKYKKVPLKRKIVLKECIIGAITIFAYYSENRTIQVLILIIASVHFFIDNRSFVLFALKKAMNMWKGIRGENE